MERWCYDAIYNICDVNILLANHPFVTWVLPFQSRSVVIHLKKQQSKDQIFISHMGEVNEWGFERSSRLLTSTWIRLKTCGCMGCEQQMEKWKKSLSPHFNSLINNTIYFFLNFNNYFDIWELQPSGQLLGHRAWPWKVVLLRGMDVRPSWDLYTLLSAFNFAMLSFLYLCSPIVALQLHQVAGQLRSSW